MLVKYNRAGVLNTHGMILIPGVNNVDAKKWADARNHPIIKAKLEDGSELEELEDIKVALKNYKTPQIDASGAEKIELGQDAIDMLKNLKQNDAKKLVSETLNLGLLEEWSEVEGRPQVKAALKAQIAKMQEPLEERDRTESRLQTTGSGPENVDLGTIKD